MEPRGTAFKSVLIGRDRTVPVIRLFSPDVGQDGYPSEAARNTDVCTRREDPVRVRDVGSCAAHRTRYAKGRVHSIRASKDAAGNDTIEPKVARMLNERVVIRGEERARMPAGNSGIEKIHSNRSRATLTAAQGEEDFH